MFNIDNHEKTILAVGYKNKTIETKYKWNQLNLMDIKALLGKNQCMPLSHIAISYIWLGETNQPINELSIGYMMNPILNTKSIQRASESMYKKYIFYINHDTNQ